MIGIECYFYMVLIESFVERYLNRRELSKEANHVISGESEGTVSVKVLRWEST